MSINVGSITIRKTDIDCIVTDENGSTYWLKDGSKYVVPKTRTTQQPRATRTFYTPGPITNFGNFRGSSYYLCKTGEVVRYGTILSDAEIASVRRNVTDSIDEEIFHVNERLIITCDNNRRNRTYLFDEMIGAVAHGYFSRYCYYITFKYDGKQCVVRCPKNDSSDLLRNMNITIKN